MTATEHVAPTQADWLLAAEAVTGPGGEAFAVARVAMLVAQLRAGLDPAPPLPEVLDELEAQALHTAGRRLDQLHRLTQRTAHARRFTP